MGKRSRGREIRLTQTETQSPPDPLAAAPRRTRQEAATGVGVRHADAFWPRLGEFVALYLVLPTVFLAFAPRVGWLIPGLVIGAVACAGFLWADPGFERRRLLNLGAVPGQWRTIGIIAVAGGAAMAVAVGVWLTPRLFDLPRRDPGLWLAIMLAYPVFSVYPQEIIYRVFLMHRYGPVFPGRWMMIAASAAAFGYGHVIFQNGLAVAMTLVGGVLFAWRYDRSRSVAAVWVEHAIWGCLIFTVGLGRFFYLGAVGR